MGVGRGQGGHIPLDFENFGKKSFFKFRVGKTKFQHFWPPPWKNPLVPPMEKILPTFISGCACPQCMRKINPSAFIHENLALQLRERCSHALYLQVTVGLHSRWRTDWCGLEVWQTSRNCSILIEKHKNKKRITAPIILTHFHKKWINSFRRHPVGEFFYKKIVS